MSKRWLPRSHGPGTRLQAGIPTGPAPKANGLLLRGVATATYLLEHPDHPEAEGGNEPVAVYCDVYIYSAMPAQRFQFLRTVLVSQQGGMHKGRVWQPRAATMNINGDPLDIDAPGANPAIMDGDHVLVGFLDDNLNAPIIIGGIPHPSADVGNEEKDRGHRMRLKAVDGDPDFQKHHGSFYGVDGNGDFVIDTTEANDGALKSDGTEADPPTDGAKGNHVTRLPEGAKVTILINGAPAMELNLSDADTVLTIGDGGVSAVIYEILENFWNNTLKPKFDAADLHAHPSGVGPTGPPTVLIGFPLLDTAIKSAQLVFSNG